VRGQVLDAELEALLLSLLAKDPDARPRDAAEVRRRAEACVCHAEWTAQDAHAWWAANPDVGGGASEPGSER
jgi:hypothetical protein